MIEHGKLHCEICDWRGKRREVLKEQNPFDMFDEIEGCPKCKSVNPFEEICDESDCKREATCGSPSPEGYRRTCGDHMPEQAKW